MANLGFYEVHRVIGKGLKLLEGPAHRKYRTVTKEEVAKRSAALRGCSLYHFQISPFAARVRRELARLQVEIPAYDVLEDPKAYAELLAGGGVDQVPCLRIAPPGAPERWLYESAEIVKFLRDAVEKPTSERS